MIELGVNIDHVATLRQARRTYEPDPVWAAVEAHLGGADGITVHLREDRRHIQDEDVRRLRELVHIKLNLEMAATQEMVDIACALKPEMAMLVPEGRQEITTEGGLNVARSEPRLKTIVATLADAGIRTSVFIDADLAQVEAAARIGASVSLVTRPAQTRSHSASSSAASSEPLTRSATERKNRAAPSSREARTSACRADGLSSPTSGSVSAAVSARCSETQPSDPGSAPSPHQTTSPAAVSSSSQAGE